VRGAGGIDDDQVLGDVGASLAMLQALPYINGKIGVFGTCSGGRHAYLAACRIPGFAALVDCWGGRVVMTAEELTPKQPVAPIDYTADLSCPVLGIFGNEDHTPTPEQVNTLEDTLKKYSKEYEFHRYDGAGHAFFYHNRPAYRQEQAMDGWSKVLTFLAKNLK
jgi:carboxymethylenebutenolidase